MKKKYFKPISGIISFLVALCILTVSQHLKAQSSIYYSYDNAGNRIGKTLIIGGTKSLALVDTNIIEIKHEELINDVSIILYPNPTEGKLRLEFHASDLIPSLNIAVYDLNGRAILNRQVTETFMELDLSSQSDGVYLLILRCGTEERHWKIIKQ